MGSKNVRGRCSWCSKETEHELVQRNYLRRNVYQCSTCLGRTVLCRIPTCDNLARGHETYDDELCAIHDGSLESWAHLPKKKHKHCSWCFQRTNHRLVEKNKIPGRRDIYECEVCCRRTLECRFCSQAMARGHAGTDDERCFTCNGSIESWSLGAEMAKARTQRTGWCSWCFEHSVHDLEEKNVLRRNVYTCDNCFGRTLGCMKCDDAMTRGGPGWDDNFCEKCLGTVQSWSAAKRRRDEIIDIAWGSDEILAQLRRSSAESRAANEAGMIRPFLFLVSMDPVMRNQVASQLGWSLYTKEYFGDPHREAWDIIHADGKGIQARTNRSLETLNLLGNNCNWYETLYRSGKEAFRKVGPEKRRFAKSIEACRDSSDTTLSRFEDWFTEKLSQLQAKHMADAQVVAIDELMETEEVRELAKNMKAAGVAGGVATVRYAVTVVHSAIKAGGFKSYIMTVKIAGAMNRNLGTKLVMSQATKSVARFAAALNAAAWAWLAYDLLVAIFGPSWGRALGPVTQILNQRLLLAAEGIRIEDYY